MAALKIQKAVAEWNANVTNARRPLADDMAMSVSITSPTLIKKDGV
ncbi:MAG: hypothetical protein H7178_00780 [Chitinophagaceae bacterium]|nr:hypothetical protein [Chitinophagaceae bacterium]